MFEGGGEGVVDGLLAAVGDDDAVGGGVDGVVSGEFSRDRGAAGERAGDGGVFGLACEGGLVGGFDDVRGRVEVGLADCERAYLVARGPHRAGAGGAPDGRGDGSGAHQPSEVTKRAMRWQACSRLAVSSA